ncbi:flagellar FliJ family protein [Hydrogenimonas sp.]
MKRYRALAKLRKRQFDMAEQALAEANAHLDALLQKKEALREQMRQVTAPSRGTGAALEAMLAQRRAIQGALAALEEPIAAARRRVGEAKARLREAHVAWEQAKSIESHFLEKLMARRKRQEAARLDEIASQKFWRLHHGEGAGR